MINTYNETTLHNYLKSQISLKFKGQTEVKIGNYICDVVTPEGVIYEIQTANLSALTKKISTLLETNPVNLIYPLPVKTYIQTINIDGTLKGTRKSPRNKNIYSIFEELFKLYPLFGNENFNLIVIPIELKKTKQLLENPVQTLQKSRRFKKNYLMVDKEAKTVGEPITFNKPKDLLSLLPQNLPDKFSSQELKQTEVKNEANKMLWVLRKMNLIEVIEKKGNLIYYKIK